MKYRKKGRQEREGEKLKEGEKGGQTETAT